MISENLNSIMCLLTLPTTLAATSGPLVTNPYEVPVYNDLAYQRLNISVSTGNPSQTFNLLLDTGASDIWFPRANSTGCAPNCPRGFDTNLSTSQIDINIPYYAAYGITPSNAIIGKYYNDTMTVGDLPPIPNAQFAVGNVTASFFRQGNWGIFGAGSRSQQASFNSPESPVRGNYSATYQPIWERLAIAASGKRRFALWLNAQNATKGSIKFGGADRKRYYGKLQRTKVNLEPNGDRWGWSVNVTSVTRIYPGVQGQKETKKVLTPRNYSRDYTIDSGSPNMYVPAELYTAITADLNVTEPLNEASYVPCKLKTPASGFLDFGFPAIRGLKESRSDEEKNFAIRVPMSEFIYPYGYPVTWPQVPDRNGEKMCYFGIVPNEFPLLIGANFLRSAYTVFDGDENEVSMTQAKWEI